MFRPLTTAITALALTVSGPAAATLIFDRSASGPQAQAESPEVAPGEAIATIKDTDGRAFKVDRSGKGAVLCSYSIYLYVQSAAKFCGWDRTASDEAVDRGIEAIEAFIFANAATPVSEEALALWRDSARRDVEQSAAREGALYCVPETDKEGGAAFALSLRAQTPEDIRKATAGLLSVPREPVMNPCL